LEKLKGLDCQTLDKINTSILNRKPTYLAVLLVDTLKESGWTAEDMGVEIINESGMLWRRTGVASYPSKYDLISS
jgi:hypothetical protein